MNNKNDRLSTDVYIKTEHQKKKKNSKVSFSVIINKVLVSALILTTIAGATTPAHAADITTKYNEAVKNYNAGANITQNYEVSVESAIYNAKLTIESIEMMKAKGTVTQEALLKLATEISLLERAVNLEAKAPSKEVIDVVLKAESVVSGVKGAEKVEAAIAVAKQSLGIKTVETKVETKQAKAVQLSDIGKHWAKKDIEKLVSLGGIAGYSDGTFKPDRTITRAEFLKIALLTVDGSVKGESSISHWASGILNAAYDLGIVREAEIPQTKEALDKNITR